MSKPERLECTCTAFGVPFRLCANDPALLDAAFEQAPLHTTAAAQEGELSTFSLERHGDAFVVEAASAATHFRSLGDALAALSRELILHVADHAPHHIFVHAGVVGWQSRALVFPGASFAGKSTLVAALVRAGATYYSDEYAVFDDAGLVHAYARPLAMREPGGTEQTAVPVERFGGVAGENALAVGRVVFTTYDPAAVWSPQPLSPALTVLRMLPHTISARRSHARAMRVLAMAVSAADRIASPRADADAFAAMLLTESVSGVTV